MSGIAERLNFVGFKKTAVSDINYLPGKVMMLL
jgi:hypothetical protein